MMAKKTKQGKITHNRVVISLVSFVCASTLIEPGSFPWSFLLLFCFYAHIRGISASCRASYVRHRHRLLPGTAPLCSSPPPAAALHFTISASPSQAQNPPWNRFGGGSPKEPPTAAQEKRWPNAAITRWVTDDACMPNAPLLRMYLSTHSTTPWKPILLQVLDIERTASDGEIKTAYRKMALVRVPHPCVVVL